MAGMAAIPCADAEYRWYGYGCCVHSTLTTAYRQQRETDKRRSDMSTVAVARRAIAPFLHLRAVKSWTKRRELCIRNQSPDNDCAFMIDYESLFVTIPTPLMILDTQLRYVAANDRYLAVTSSRWEDIGGRYIFEAFPEAPERWAAINDGFQRALAGETSRLEKLVFAIRQPDGSVRDMYWTATHQPVRSRDGSIIGVMQNTTDVTSEVAAERMREVISQEYDHRVRNILTKVSAIARRTARSTSTMSQFIADFDPRIASMARAHQMLVHGGWEHLGLAELVDAELQPYAPQWAGQIVVTGDNIALSSRVAQALGMALHELATNAVKYGALSTPAGRLRVGWQRATDGALQIDWVESGLTGLAVPSHTGFGSSIIDRILPAETGGTVSRRFDPGGMTCEILLPLPTAD